MGKLVTLALAALGLLFCLTAWAAGPNAIGDQVGPGAKWEVAGIVADVETDQPLAGIRLKMHCAPRANAMQYSVDTTTDAFGRFSFAARQNSYVQIMIPDQIGDGYLIDEKWQTPPRGFDRKYVIPSLGEAITDLKLPLKLRKLAPLKGRVVDVLGNPAAKVGVIIAGVAPVITDTQGYFSFKAAPTDRPGQIRVVGEDLGAIAPFEAGQKEIDLKAVSPVSLECLFTTPEGAPADKLSFTLTQQPVPGSTPRQVAMETDAQGKCRLEEMIVGAGLVVSWSPHGDYSRGQVTLMAELPGAPMRVTVPKYDNGFLLVVENEDGQAVKGAKVRLENSNIVRNDKLHLANNLRTDAEGSVRLQNLAGGILNLNVMADGYRPHNIVALVKDGKHVARLTRNDSPAQYSVLVLTAEGKPAANLTVRVIKDGKETTPLQTDAEGRLVATGNVHGGETTFFCSSPELGWSVATVPTFFQSYSDGSSIMRLHKTVSPHKLRLVSSDGKPLSRAILTISGLSEPIANHSNLEESTTISDEIATELGLFQVTDENGMATFPQVDSHFSVGVVIEAAAYPRKQSGFASADGASVTEIRIEKMSLITGKLILPPGADAQPKDYFVKAQPTTSGRGGHQSGVNTNGTFTLQVEPGEYKLTAYPTDAVARYLVRSRAVAKALEDQMTTVELVLKEGIPVRGKYISGDGKAGAQLPKMAIELAGYDRNMKLLPIKKDGTFEFFVPGPGEYPLSFDVIGTGRVAVEVINVPSEEAVENLEIEG